MGLNQEGKAEASVAALQKMMIVQTQGPPRRVADQIPDGGARPGRHRDSRGGRPGPGRRPDHQGRHARDRRVGADRRERCRSRSRSIRSPAGHAARRPRRHGVHEHPVSRAAPATILVTATGMATEVGHISGMLPATEDEKTPLTRQLDALTNQILVIAGRRAGCSRSRIGLLRLRPRRSTCCSCRPSRSPSPPSRPACRPSSRTLLAIGTTTLAAGRRHRQAPPLGRDARLHVGHQLGQDRAR